MKKHFILVPIIMLFLAANSAVAASADYEIPPDRDVWVVVKDPGSYLYDVVTTLIYIRPEGERAIILLSLPFGYSGMHFIECRVSRGEELPIESDWVLKIIDFNTGVLKLSLRGQGKEFSMEVLPPSVHGIIYERWKEKQKQ